MTPDKARETIVAEWLGLDVTLRTDADVEAFAAGACERHRFPAPQGDRQSMVAEWLRHASVVSREAAAAR